MLSQTPYVVSEGDISYITPDPNYAHLEYSRGHEILKINPVSDQEELLFTLEDEPQSFITYDDLCLYWSLDNAVLLHARDNPEGKREDCIIQAVNGLIKFSHLGGYLFAFTSGAMYRIGVLSRTVACVKDDVDMYFSASKNFATGPGCILLWTDPNTVIKITVEVNLVSIVMCGNYIWAYSDCHMAYLLEIHAKSSFNADAPGTEGISIRTLDFDMNGYVDLIDSFQIASSDQLLIPELSTNGSYVYMTYPGGIGMKCGIHPITVESQFNTCQSVDQAVCIPTDTVTALYQLTTGALLKQAL